MPKMATKPPTGNAFSHVFTLFFNDVDMDVFSQRSSSHGKRGIATQFNV